MGEALDLESMHHFALTLEAQVYLQALWRELMVAARESLVELKEVWLTVALVESWFGPREMLSVVRQMSAEKTRDWDLLSSEVNLEMPLWPEQIFVEVVSRPSDIVRFAKGVVLQLLVMARVFNGVVLTLPLGRSSERLEFCPGYPHESEALDARILVRYVQGMEMTKMFFGMSEYVIPVKFPLELEGVDEEEMVTKVFSVPRAMPVVDVQKLRTVGMMSLVRKVK
jgi:hypothetical protein